MTVGLNAAAYILWVAQGTIAPHILQAFVETLRLLGADLSQFAAEPDNPGRDILDVFPHVPMKRHLHVIVQIPHHGERCAPTSDSPYIR